MMRLLVTGATGLLGRRVVPLLLEAGHQVSTTARGGADGRSHHQVDLTDVLAVKTLLDQVRPDAVLHLAGGASPSRVAMLRGNVDATSTLLHVLSDRGGQLGRLVVTGSSAEFGDASDGDLVGEQGSLAPVTPYGRAKAAQTMIVEMMAPAVARDASVVVARPFNVVAPDLPASSPLGNLRRQLLGTRGAAAGDARRVLCGRRDVVRDFVSADMVAEALVALLLMPEPPRTVNLCSGRPTVLGDLFCAIARRAGLDVEFVEDPALAGLPAVQAVVGDPSLLQKLGLYREETEEDLADLMLGQTKGVTEAR